MYALVIYFTDFVNVDCVCSKYTIFYVSLLSKYNTPIPTHAHTIFYYYHQSTSKQHPRPRGVKMQSIIVILLVTGHHRDILMPYHRGGMERIVVVGPCIRKVGRKNNRRRRTILPMMNVLKKVRTPCC